LHIDYRLVYILGLVSCGGCDGRIFFSCEAKTKGRKKERKKRGGISSFLGICLMGYCKCTVREMMDGWMGNLAAWR